MRDAHTIDVVHVYVVHALGELAVVLVEFGQRPFATILTVELYRLGHLRNDIVLRRYVAGIGTQWQRHHEQQRCEQRPDLPDHAPSETLSTGAPRARSLVGAQDTDSIAGHPGGNAQFV